MNPLIRSARAALDSLALNTALLLRNKDQRATGGNPQERPFAGKERHRAASLLIPTAPHIVLPAQPA